MAARSLKLIAHGRKNVMGKRRLFFFAFLARLQKAAAVVGKKLRARTVNCDVVIIMMMT